MALCTQTYMQSERCVSMRLNAAVCCVAHHRKKAGE